MKLPKLKDMLARFKLGDRLKSLLSGLPMQLGSAIQPAEQSPAPRSFLQRVFGANQDAPTRPKTQTPHYDQVMRILTEHRQREAAKALRQSMAPPSAIAPTKATRNRPLASPPASSSPRSTSETSGTRSPTTRNSGASGAGSSVAKNQLPPVIAPPVAATKPAAPHFASAGGNSSSAPASRPAAPPTTAVPSRERSTAAVLADARAKRDAPATTPTTATPNVKDVTRAAAATAHDKAGAKEGFNLSDKLDAAQLTADAVGIFDPSGLVDGVNAGVSLGRAVIEPSRAPEHLFNALVSGISVVPYLGDVAKLAKIPRAAKTATKAGKAMKGASTAAHGGRAARKGASISESLSPGRLGSLLSQGPQGVFAKADRATSADAIYSGLRHEVGPQPHVGGSFLHRHIVSPMMRGASSLFRRGKGQHAASTGTRHAPAHGPTPPASGATQMPFWQEPPVIPHGTPSGERGEMLITSILREKWQSFFGMSGGTPGRGSAAAAAPPGSRPAAGRGGSAAPPGSPPRRPTATGSPGDGGDDRWWKRIIGMFSGQQPPALQAAAGPAGPMGPPPQRPGERIAGVFGSWLGGGSAAPKRKAEPVAMNDVLRSGTNFGDIMGGKKSYEDAEKEIQANRQLEESKRKLIDATKSATGKLGGLALSAAGLVKTLHLVNAGTLARQMALTELSPGHAFAAGKSEAHRIRLDIERGRETSGSFARLSDRQNEMERALAPGRNLMTNVSNNLLAHLTSWATQIIRGVNIIAKETGKYAEIGAKGGGIVGGGLIGGPIGAIVGKRLADKGIEAAKGLGDGTPSGPQPEHWTKLFDDIAAGKLTGPKMPRKF